MGRGCDLIGGTLSPERLEGAVHFWMWLALAPWILLIIHALFVKSPPQYLQPQEHEPPLRLISDTGVQDKLDKIARAQGKGRL